MTNSRQTPGYRQRGIFVIECMLIMGVMTLIIGFTIDMISAQNIHGRLQRLAYSGSTLIRERAALYRSRQELSADDVNNLFRVLSHSLSRTYNKYTPDNLGLHVEQIVYQASSDSISSVEYQQGRFCQPIRRSKENHSLFTRRQDMTIYQVTLCHEADSFYHRLLGRSETIRASMLMPER